MKPDPKLIQQMQKVGSGADIHTINKARSYYTHNKINQETLAKLDKMIRKALSSGDWSALRRKMQRWF